MRVITGTARGCRLDTLPGLDTRPTLDKVKEGLFSAIQFDIEGRRVLDLFAGSGQLGIEALSRGAAYCVFVDRNPAAVPIIRGNLQRAHLAPVAQVIGTDSMIYLDHLKERFDLVFLDPPYRMTEVYADAIARLDAADMLAPDAVIAAERRQAVPVVYPEGFEVYDTRNYGETSIDFVRRRSE